VVLHPAFAAQGGKNATSGSNSGLAVAMVWDANNNGAPNYNDDINFTFTQTATKYPQVGLRCYQGYNWVYDGYVSYWAGAWASQTKFTLNSNNWDPALTANCNARLFYYDRRSREQVLGRLAFDVAP